MKFSISLAMLSTFRNKKYVRALSPWEAAWTIVAPVAYWLIFTKVCKIAYTAATWLGTGPDGDTLRDQIQWIMDFAWPRFFIAACGTWVIYRIFRKWLKPVVVPFLYLALIFGMASLRSALPPHRSPLSIVGEWGHRFIPEFQVLLSGIWREPMTLAALVLALGSLLRLVPARFSTTAVRASQIAMVLLGFGISVDLVYLIATGQPLSAPIVSFTSAHLHDLIPLMQAEVTKGRVLLLVAGIAFPAAWAWRYNDLGQGFLRHAPGFSLSHCP
jgi:hypothetical protein